MRVVQIGCILLGFIVAISARAGQPALELVERLVLMAKGDETPASQRKNNPAPKAPEAGTEDIGRQAAALLGDPDPFVRGLAEWAIAIRLGAECEGRKFKSWPDAKACDWYKRWLALDGQALLECDYVRQAAGLEWHRSSESLAKSADVLLTRAERLTTWVTQTRGGKPAEIVRDRLSRVRQARATLADFAKLNPDDLVGQRKLWLAMRLAVREVALANPDINFNQIVFATRTGSDSGNITNGSLRDAYGPGGDIYIKSGLSPSEPARPLIAGRLGVGHLRGMDIWWDADQLVFSYLKQPKYDPTKDANAENTELGRSEPAHLYEMKIDGSGLRQLTNLPHNSDIEPCYLPNGDIVFCSDRSNYGSQCSGMLQQDKMIVNLFRCSPDGSNIRWLSNNKDFDRYPHVMDNGQILFVHWEYQERHLWQTHTLWTCRPDGSMTDAIYKQHIEGGPMSLREARQIPGQNALVAIACGHHNGEIGSVFTVDWSRGVNEAEGMRTVTPLVSSTEGGYGKVKPVPEGGVQDVGGHYQFPYPLSDKSFLVAYSYKKPENASARNYGLYYIDVWGNKELIHRDRQLSVAYLMPVRKTVKPPVLRETPPDLEPGPAYATMAMSNANYGLKLDSPRAVRYIRICQKMPWPCVRDESKPWGYNHLHATPAGAWTHVFGSWDWSPARVIGIVPVEADGSAHFKAPVDQTVYFQALDENFLELRRMRSNVTFQKGEVRSCTGCHETQAIAPPSTGWGATGIALRREASMPEAPAWGNRNLPNYERDLQPIFDRHCVSCHSEKDAKGGLDFSGRKVGDYAQSYRTIFGLKGNEPTPIVSEDAWRWLHPGEPAPPVNKDWYKLIEKNAAPGQLVVLSNRFGGAEVTPAMQFGSGRSKLILSLLNHPEHVKSVKLPRQDWIALTTWVDLNAPYFDTFADKNPTGPSKAARWVKVEFPDPWLAPPAGEWVWKDEQTVILKARSR